MMRRCIMEEIDFGVIAFQFHEDYKKICKILNIEPNLMVDPTLKNGYYETGTDTVYIGLASDASWECRRYRQKKLVHEMLHASGLEHNAQSRSFGFYSSLQRDIFSDKILEWIFYKPKRSQKGYEQWKKNRKAR